MDNIGTKIRKRREELNLTQQQLADLMGYKSKSTINKVELGINDLPQKAIVKYAEALQTSVAYLMDWEEPEQETIVLDPVKAKCIKQIFEVLDSITEEECNALVDYARFIASKRMVEK